MTDVVHAPEAFRHACDKARSQDARIGLVPTMGALHEGHLSLIRETRQRGADFLVVSIFVNPLQFGPNEDYGSYPRTLDTDIQRCRELGVDLVFAPERSAMYGERFQTQVEVEELTETLEGRFRPGHFRGVTTVVAKLFNLTGPCLAAFGRKDFQQWRVIERMAADLDMPIKVIGCPIVRESDGLALSSRNAYLSDVERRRAAGIAQGLRAAQSAWDGGERDARRLEQLVRDPVEAHFDRIDYVAVVDPYTLAPLQGPVEDDALVAVAARIGKTRLIDNAWLGARPG